MCTHQHTQWKNGCKTKLLKIGKWQLKIYKLSFSSMKSHATQQVSEDKKQMV